MVRVFWLLLFCMTDFRPSQLQVRAEPHTHTPVSKITTTGSNSGDKWFLELNLSKYSPVVVAAECRRGSWLTPRRSQIWDQRRGGIGGVEERWNRRRNWRWIGAVHSQWEVGSSESWDRRMRKSKRLGLSILGFGSQRRLSVSSYFFHSKRLLAPLGYDAY